MDIPFSIHLVGYKYEILREGQLKHLGRWMDLMFDIKLQNPKSSFFLNKNEFIFLY